MVQLLEQGEQKPSPISRLPAACYMSGGSSIGNEGKQPLYRRRQSTRPPDVKQPQHAQEQIVHLERLGGQQALELDLLRSVSILLTCCPHRCQKTFSSIRP
jgi:hypothetical protein